MSLEMRAHELADEIAEDLRHSVPLRGIAEHYLQLEAEVDRLRKLVDGLNAVMEQLDRDRVIAIERDQLRAEVADLRSALQGIDRDIDWEPALANDEFDRQVLSQALKTAAGVVAARKQRALR